MLLVWPEYLSLSNNLWVWPEFWVYLSKSNIEICCGHGLSPCGGRGLSPCGGRGGGVSHVMGRHSLMTLSLAVLVATPSVLETVHVYMPSSDSSTSLIRRTQFSSPQLAKARSITSRRPSWLHSTLGGGWGLSESWQRKVTERPAMTVSSERWVEIWGGWGVRGSWGGH